MGRIRTRFALSARTPLVADAVFLGAALLALSGDEGVAVVLLGVELVVSLAAKLDVLRVVLAALGPGHAVVKLYAPLRIAAMALGADERATASIAFPNRTANLRGNGPRAPLAGIGRGRCAFPWSLGLCGLALQRLLEKHVECPFDDRRWIAIGQMVA